MVEGDLKERTFAGAVHAEAVDTENPVRIENEGLGFFSECPNYPVALRTTASRQRYRSPISPGPGFRYLTTSNVPGWYITE